MSKPLYTMEVVDNLGAEVTMHADNPEVLHEIAEGYKDREEVMFIELITSVPNDDGLYQRVLGEFIKEPTWQ